MSAIRIMATSAILTDNSRCMDYKKAYRTKCQTTKVANYKAKRGNLAPLMTEEAKASAGIYELSYDFACRITRL